MALKNLSLNYKNRLGFSEKFIIKTSERLLPYFQKIKKILKEKNNQEPESFLNLEVVNLKKIQTVAYEKTKSVKFLILIGIGGSISATQAIYEVLKKEFISYKNFLQPIFLDNLSALSLKETFDFLKKQKSKEILIVLVSQSGKTLESLINFNVLAQFLKKEKKQFENRSVIITEKNSLLWQIAEKKNFTLLEIPKAVSGRYAVFSNVSLFPLAALGINLYKFIAGAKTMRDRCLKEKNNPALMLAAFLFFNAKKGKTIVDYFFFEPALEFLRNWQKQLVAESLGKNKYGLTPTISLGPRDLHSLFQLSLAGPKNKATVFVSCFSSFKIFIKILPEFEKTIPFLKKKSVSEIVEAIFESVKNVYAKKNLPFVEIVLPKINEFYLGQFLMLQMMSIIFLAQLLKVNAFNQPAVALYKTKVLKMLKK